MGFNPNFAAGRAIMTGVAGSLDERMRVPEVCGTMATLTLRDHFRAVSRGTPGTRFKSYYERSKRERKSGAAKSRILRFILALFLFAIGVVLVFIPGPAVLFFFLAGGLLASESLLMARMMDWLEVRVRAIWHWGKQRWQRLPLVSKIALALLGVLCGAGASWAGWKLLAG